MSQGHKACPILALMKHYDVPETREEFLKLFYVGNVPEEIPAEEECGFPAKFQLVTLLDTPPASEAIQ
jgi:hypothetical protein